MKAFILVFIPTILFAEISITEPSNALISSIAKIESNHNPLAYNRKEGARGIFQIRKCCLQDVNRIYKTSFVTNDCWSATKSLSIMRKYLRYYGEHYYKTTGKLPTDEIYARIWNGGPNGWRKESTEEYWRKVCKVLNLLKN